MKINEKQWPALSVSRFNEGNGGRDVETKERGEMDRERKGEKGSLMNVGLGEKWQIYLNSNFATQDLFN